MAVRTPDLEYWRLRIAIDRNYALGFLHARQVLYGARDAHSNVEVWSNNLPCLSNLDISTSPVRTMKKTQRGECA